MKTMRDKGLISIEDVWEIVCVVSNVHVTDDVTRPYDIIVITQYNTYITSTGLFYSVILLSRNTDHA